MDTSQFTSTPLSSSNFAFGDPSPVDVPSWRDLAGAAASACVETFPEAVKYLQLENEQLRASLQSQYAKLLAGKIAFDELASRLAGAELLIEELKSQVRHQHYEKASILMPTVADDEMLQAGCDADGDTDFVSLHEAYSAMVEVVQSRGGVCDMEYCIDTPDAVLPLRVEAAEPVNNSLRLPPGNIVSGDPRPLAVEKRAGALYQPPYATVKKSSLRPSVLTKIEKYLSPELVDRSGFRVVNIKVTPKLGDQLKEYIYKNGFYTFGQTKKNHRQVDFVYSPNFSVKKYIGYSGECTSCYIDVGAVGFSGGKHGKEEYKRKAKSCMTLINLYFFILEKYPEHLLDINFRIDPPLPTDRRVRKTKEEWMRSFPMLSEEEAQKLADNPPLVGTELYHDSPL